MHNVIYKWWIQFTSAPGRFCVDPTPIVPRLPPPKPAKTWSVALDSGFAHDSANPPSNFHSDVGMSNDQKSFIPPFDDDSNA